MFSLRKFFGHDEKFFDLLEASAEQADSSVHHLVALLAKLEHHDSPQSLDEFVHSRRKDKEITQELTEQLCKTFITPLEREDIQALAAALYKIPKTVEKFAERYQIALHQIRGTDFGPQVKLMDQAVHLVLQMTQALRAGRNLGGIKSLQNELQTLESEADDVLLELTKRFYEPGFPALQAVILKDLYDLNEKVVDRCRDAGNVISHALLKNA